MPPLAQVNVSVPPSPAFATKAAPGGNGGRGGGGEGGGGAGGGAEAQVYLKLTCFLVPSHPAGCRPPNVEVLAVKLHTPARYWHLLAMTLRTKVCGVGRAGGVVCWFAAAPAEPRGGCAHAPGLQQHKIKTFASRCVLRVAVCCVQAVAAPDRVDNLEGREEG